MVVQTCLQSSQIISVQPVGWEQMEENGRVCSEWDLLCDFICIAWIWWRIICLIHSLMELYNHGGSVARGIHWALHELETKNRKELELLRKKKVTNKQAGKSLIFICRRESVLLLNGKIGILVPQLRSEGQVGPSTFIFRSNLLLCWCGSSY